jgi:serine/threonine protein kinase
MTPNEIINSPIVSAPNTGPFRPVAISPLQPVLSRLRFWRWLCEPLRVSDQARFSPNQGFLDPPEIDLQHAVYSRLRRGAAIHFFLFGIFWALDSFFNPFPSDGWGRARLRVQGVIALVAASEWCWLKWGKIHPWRMMYALMYLLISSVVLFLILYQIEHLRVAYWSRYAAPLHEAGALDATADACTFRWYVLLVAEGIFIPDPLRESFGGKRFLKWLGRSLSRALPLGTPRIDQLPGHSGGTVGNAETTVHSPQSASTNSATPGALNSRRSLLHRLSRRFRFLWRMVRRVLFPKSRTSLPRVLNVVAVGAVCLTAGIYYSDNNLSARIGTLFEMAIWLILSRAMAYFGTYTLQQLERKASEAETLGIYTLGNRLGSGGMGEVFLTTHPSMNRPSAIKLIRRTSSVTDQILERFQREIHVTAMLTDPNTVRIYDEGRARDGTCYYVMEYLPGFNLDNLVAHHKAPLPAGRVVHLLRQVCGALTEAHHHRLIHRDLKPSNIIATRLGERYDWAKLLDFGLVKPTETPLAAQLTGDRHILGTHAYMSPEQAGGFEVDARSDIYSLGAVAYFLLTGRAPFEGENAVVVMSHHILTAPEPPSQVRSDLDIPRDLNDVIMRCLAKKPEDRYQNTRSLEKALGDCTCANDWTEALAEVTWKGHNYPDHCKDDVPNSGETCPGDSG